ncbi:MAG: 4-oxalocrotonate tautomerase family protein [Promethearchaeota archaeon]|nr:MAG: 4-oxalocrotonate tautomerase family protein [Candidatus Lokiarchaeota archaeon]
MPVVNVKVWKGISEEYIRKIISGITDVFVDLGIPREAVEVIIQEIPKGHWGIGGKPATEALPDEHPPK